MYSTPHGTSQKSPLAARLFGIVDFYSAVIRFYAAYNMENKPLYALATLTYVVMLTHFVGEWVVFGTARGREVGPAVGSTALGVLLMMLGWWE
jgi:Erg28 like protein